MTLDDITDLLGLCAQYDGRELGDDTAAAWLLLLEDIPAADAASAIREHYRTDRRWIMPADIVAHHETLELARLVEKARQDPPPCWGRDCGTRYVLSERPGSLFAYPHGPHDPECTAMQGVLMFNPDEDNPRWSVMPVDPAAFDEVAWEANAKQVAARMARYRDEMAAEPGYGPRELGDGR